VRVYRRAFAPTAGEALRAGKYKIDAVFSGVAVRAVGEKELGPSGISNGCFLMFNTPGDLVRLRTSVETRRAASSTIKTIEPESPLMQC